MPAYVPPALRKKAGTEHQASPPGQGEAPPAKVNPRRQSREELYSVTDLRHHFWPHSSQEDAPLSTLNNSAERPFELTWLLLHKGQNPRWKTDNIVFAKTSLNLLPDYFEKKDKTIREWEKHDPQDSNIEDQSSSLKQSSLDVQESRPRPTAEQNDHHEDQNADGSSPEVPKDAENVDTAFDVESIESYTRRRQLRINSAPAIDWEPSAQPPLPPIAVFHEAHQKEYRFIGWYTISRVTILAPYSQELVRMLEQKWTVLDRFGNPKKEVGRDSSGWQRSLAYEWAVVKFEKTEGQDTPAPPSIEHAIPPEPEPPRKSVNELLAEMRLADKGNRKVDSEADNKKLTGSNEAQTDSHGKENSV